MIDRQTGRSRGFGFVRVATSEGAQPAENLPPPKKADADPDDGEQKLPAARAKTQPRVEPPQQQNAHGFQQEYSSDPQDLQSAYMAGMYAQSWLQMSQQFNPMAFNPMMGYPPFYPYPTPA